MSWDLIPNIRDQIPRMMQRANCGPATTYGVGSDPEAARGEEPGGSEFALT